MTPKEFVDKILNSSSSNWFKTLEVNFKLPVISSSKTFKGLSEFHKYLTFQVNGYKEVNNLPKVLEGSKSFFEENLKNVEGFLVKYSNYSENSLDQYWQRATTQNSNDYRVRLSDTEVLYYNDERTKYLIEINQLNKNFTIGAYKYYRSQQIGTPREGVIKNEFVGALLAYEFEDPRSKLSKRHDSVNKKIKELNLIVETLLSQNESHLLESLEKSKADYQNYTNKIDQFKAEKESVFNDWFEGNSEKEVLGVQKEFDNFKTKIAELENLYEKKLKLKKPAEYWKKRAEKLRKQGWIAFAALLVFVGTVVWSLGELLWKTPEQIYSSFFGGDKSAAIRWSIIYATLISFMAFCVKAITKVMFSSFHLAQDSEERNALTYFYLSLHNDADIDKTERQLVMQSLFSRADTGLLKDDSGPTMPNDMTGRLFGGK